MTPHAASATPEIEDFRRQLSAIKQRAAALLAPLREDDLLSRPAPGAWSVAECLHHLNVTAEASLVMVDEALARARGQTGAGPFRPRWFMRPLIRGVEPPVRLRLKTTKAFLPPATLEPQAVAQDFMALQERLLEQLAGMSGYDLNRIRVRSPFVRQIRYTLYEWWAVLLAHERRHLWQAEQAIYSLPRSKDSVIE